MKVLVSNLRKETCALSGRTGQCVDVKSQDQESLVLTVCLKMLPDLLVNLDFQSIVQAATSADGVNRRLQEASATS